MGIVKNLAPDEHRVEIAGNFFTMRTAEKERLQGAATWLNHRIKVHLEKHPLLKPNEAYLLLLLHLAFEREDFQDSGKALLKQTDQLLEWLNHQI